MRILASALAAALGLASAAGAPADPSGPLNRIDLAGAWRMQSSVLDARDGAALSRGGLPLGHWHPVQVPTTVLNALTKLGVYPDLRVGMNAEQIPDASEAFNQKYDLTKFSHLPGQRNPWRDAWWFRKEFTLPKLPAGQRAWLHFDCINYRAEVWLNGARVADTNALVGMFQRFDLDITAHAKAGTNALAVKILPVDHPGVPERQTEPLGRERSYAQDIMRDVTMVMTIGYDCMPTVPDRNMGILQDVWVNWTGPVVIRHPFVVTELPLPETNYAALRISAELVNAATTSVAGVLRGRVAGTEVRFEQRVALGPGETREIAITPKPLLRSPRLWWPRGYGDQALYRLELACEINKRASDQTSASFGVRQVASEIHERNGWHGRRVLINGQRIFCRGGYIQPELLLDWDARRIEAELRYFAEANLNLIYFEDLPNPPDALLEACDRLGIMFGECCYACYWPRPGTDHPQDPGLLLRCTADFIKRYRNHPSLVMYMAQNEGETRRDLYEPWRKLVLGLDGTRWLIPSASFASDRKNTDAWVKQDLPTGMTDTGASYGWAEPAQYFDWVRAGRHWRFMMEGGSASVPPMSSLAKFIPGLRPREGRFGPDSVWAHHDACHYFKPFDDALRRLHGEATDAVDYAWKAHLLAADQHRSMFEAVNHKMWEITSGVTQWKINACWPSVEWQVCDWYLKPMVSWFYLKKAGEPLHVQLNLPERTTSVINWQLAPRRNLKLQARVFDVDSKLVWEQAALVSAPANGFQESFAIPEPPGTPLFFVKLELTDAQGRLVSENFYWLRAKDTPDYRALQSLPLVKLRATCDLATRGADRVAHVSVRNPSERLAFFVQLALTQGRGGAEILPVLWEDNYFSLLPGETRDVKAFFAARDVGSDRPTLGVGGWNVDSEFDCVALSALPRQPNADGLLTVTVQIANTFLDGSRVVLSADGQPIASKWAWARGGTRQQAYFEVRLSEPGPHRLSVGKRSLDVKVEPR